LKSNPERYAIYGHLCLVVEVMHDP
jgi:hypothetical protein